MFRVIDNLLTNMKRLFISGFFHITGTSAANKLIAAITNILIVRSLGRHSYGLFCSAYNIYSMFVLFSGFGMQAAILVYCSEDRSEAEKQAYYRYGMIAGFAASAILSLGMLLYALFGKLGIEETRSYTVMLSLLPLLDYVMRYFLIILRSRRQNIRYARYTMVSSVTYFALGCTGAYFGGIHGTIVGRYLSYLLVIFLCGKELYPLCRNRCFLDKGQKKDLWQYSVKNGLSGALNQVLYVVDVALIAFLISDAETVASYKVAVVIPEAMAFIPSAIMVYLLPVIAMHNHDNQWLRVRIARFLIYSGVFHAILSILLVIFAPYIITLLWGSEYLDSVVCFRILSVNYFFMATFRMPCTNVLAVLRKVNFNLFLGVAAAVLDISLDYILIKNFSSTGAAAATLLTVLFISMMSVPYLIRSIRGNENGSMFHS